MKCTLLIQQSMVLIDIRESNFRRRMIWMGMDGGGLAQGPPFLVTGF
jgi:hypothetical protein